MGDMSAEVVQGESLGFFALGASLHDTLTYIKSQVLLYPQIDLSFSQQFPLHVPIVVRLRANGIQLRFDAREQRLRMIEVTDFTRMKLTYKGHDIIRLSDGSTEPYSNTAGNIGPLFKNVYKLFGPTTPGEYVPPPQQSDGNAQQGTYCLSYPGISFNFSIDASAWSSSLSWSSVVSLLSSSATTPAWSMCVFHGESWPKARPHVFTTELPFPLSPSFGRADNSMSKEIDHVKIHAEGRLELVRRNATSTWVITGETTPQDLVTELGPPDAIYRRTDKRQSLHNGRSKARSGNRRPSSNDVIRPSSYGGMSDASSATADSNSEFDTDEDDVDDEAANEGSTTQATSARKQEEQWYNYYRHGLDILIGTASSISTAPPGRGLNHDVTTDKNHANSGSHHHHQQQQRQHQQQPCARSHQTVVKVQLQGNIPGSWQFNRHRRVRWELAEEIYGSTIAGEEDEEEAEGGNEDYPPASPSKLNSELPFHEISAALKAVFETTYSNEEEARTLQQPMALNRGWGGESLGGSMELLGGGGGGGGGGGRGISNRQGQRINPPQENQDIIASTASGASNGGGASAIGSTELYGFPGLIFEIMKNGAVAGLLVY